MAANPSNNNQLLPKAPHHPHRTFAHRYSWPESREFVRSLSPSLAELPYSTSLISTSHIDIYQLNHGPPVAYRQCHHAVAAEVDAVDLVTTGAGVVVAPFKEAFEARGEAVVALIVAVAASEEVVEEALEVSMTPKRRFSGELPCHFIVLYYR